MDIAYTKLSRLKLDKYTQVHMPIVRQQKTQTDVSRYNQIDIGEESHLRDTHEGPSDSEADVRSEDVASCWATRITPPHESVSTAKAHIQTS